MTIQLTEKTYKCQRCSGENVRELNALTGREGWLRKHIVCANDKCSNIIDFEDIRMSCECGNKTFVTSKVGKNDEGAEKHLGKMSILCSNVIECGKTVAYID